jgi:hypothetical protein
MREGELHRTSVSEKSSESVELVDWGMGSLGKANRLVDSGEVHRGETTVGESVNGQAKLGISVKRESGRVLSRDGPAKPRIHC